MYIRCFFRTCISHLLHKCGSVSWKCFQIAAQATLMQHYRRSSKYRSDITPLRRHLMALLLDPLLHPRIVHFVMLGSGTDPISLLSLLLLLFCGILASNENAFSHWLWPRGLCRGVSVEPEVEIWRHRWRWIVLCWHISSHICNCFHACHIFRKYSYSLRISNVQRLSNLTDV